ncbi:hypothetical protein QR680_010278 [Steinernema hermaphroditum]|uniref:Uncharacterized protein n=1 Tax=Steinernema hermaphroditum TaxID=289476 RepID=A0AA39IQ17_9BILA|nr:hypothetical protein QR680_010278 [Steinernema hermaphroditum]
MRLRTAEGNVEAGPLLVEIAIFTIVILASVFALLAMIDDYPPYVFPFYVTLGAAWKMDFEDVEELELQGLRVQEQKKRDNLARQRGEVEVYSAMCCMAPTFTTIIALLAFVGAIIQLIATIGIGKETSRMAQEVSLLFLANLSGCFWWIATSLLTLYAMLNDSPSLVYPFYLMLVFTSAVLGNSALVCTIHFLYHFVAKKEDVSSIPFFLLLFVVFPFFLYCTSVVKDCYQGFKAKRRREVEVQRCAEAGL